MSLLGFPLRQLQGGGGTCIQYGTCHQYIACLCPAVLIIVWLRNVVSIIIAYDESIVCNNHVVYEIKEEVEQHIKHVFMSAWAGVCSHGMRVVHNIWVAYKYRQRYIMCPQVYILHILTTCAHQA